MKVAAIQMISTPHVANNLETALSLLQQAAEEGAKLAVLPEYFCAMQHSDRDKLAIAENNGDLLHGLIQSTISKAAKDLNLWIVAGTLPLHTEESPAHVYNACLVYNPQGEQVTRYDKIHLFRFLHPKEEHDETRTLFAGTTPKTFILPQGDINYKCGLSICYDLRFPELYRQLSAPNTRPCDIMFVPSAFTYTTGQAHWEILLRARAIENQCYIIAAAQGGQHQNGRHTWGHSMIIDPWGEILAVKESGMGIIYADILSEHLQLVRTQLPALSDRMLID